MAVGLGKKRLAQSFHILMQLFPYVIYQWRDHNPFVYKKYNSLSSLLSRKGRNVTGVRDTPTETETKDSDCYIWHHIFLTHVVILYSGPNLVLLWLDWSMPLLNSRPLASRSIAKAASALTARFFWVTCGDWNCVPQTANLLSLYNINNAHAFSLRFPIHVILFRCPFVYTGAYPV